VTKRTDQPQPEPTPTAPQPNTVAAEPATVETCQMDYQQRTEANHGGHFTATPHTHHRR
jgi:hypothetical protein